MIIPAYNAGGSIYENLKKLHKILVSTGKSFEIICVVDGASDATDVKAKKAQKDLSHIKVFNYFMNRGKGYAVKYGMTRAKGNMVGFVDSGWDLKYEDLLSFFKIMKREKADIVIGSKKHARSKVNYSRFRKVFSKGYQLYVKNLFGLKINDTQAGMKIFKKNILDKILPVTIVDGYAFDIELLAIADKYFKAKIKEAPIHVNFEKGTSSINIKGGFMINSIRVFWDTLKIFYRLKISNYYKRKLNIR